MSEVREIEIQAEDTSSVVHDDKIILDGEDISRYVTGYEIQAHVGESRKIILHLISTKHMMALASRGEIIPKMELGGKTYRLVEEESNNGTT